MNYGSVCSGIEAASVAWHPLGWTPAWFAEVEPFPSAVLARHWPEVPNMGDFTQIRNSIADGTAHAPDILVGGTPCQAFSVAGLRQSLDDKRGQLTLEFVRLADVIDASRFLRGKQPVTVVWENVPGVLNTTDNAFGCFLGALAGEAAPRIPPRGKWTNAGRVLGPTRAVAWRILDAQYFGVAQRRRRVFVVASAGALRPEQLLFEFDGVRRDSPPRREAGKGFAAVAGTLAANGGGLTRPAGNCNELDFRVPVGVSEGPDLAHCLRSGASKADKHESTTYIVAPQQQVFGGNRTSGESDISPSLLDQGGRKDDFESEAFVTYGLDEEQNPTRDFFGTLKARSKGGGFEGTVALPEVQVGTLAIRGRDDGSSLEARYDGTPNAILTPSGGRAGIGVGAVHAGMQVRRLTPTECERLQGFPDGHTRIPWRGKPAEECPDGPRYKALGNSMAVPVMRWIGARISLHTPASLAQHTHKT